jgi:hypothetical protein
MKENARSRWRLGVGVVVVVGLGLASRRFPVLFPAVLGKYPGDALWALMVYLGWAFWLPRAAVWRVGLLALATSGLVECSQLYQAEWIHAIRSTMLGHLVLGSTFVWQDLVAYAVGVAIGVVVDGRVFRGGGTQGDCRIATGAGG